LGHIKKLGPRKEGKKIKEEKGSHVWADSVGPDWAVWSDCFLFSLSIFISILSCNLFKLALN
jgi:hypothetical protein